MTVSRAKATTFGAVSIVNAIAGGKGATASVRLPTEAEVEVEDSPGEWEITVNGRKSDSRLGPETAKRAVAMAGRDPRAYSGRIATSSNVPIGVGLKTSSASSTATAVAVFAALGHKAFDPKKVLECSVEASLAAGASVTGAMDDAAGCLLGGVNMTDNLGRKVISSRLFEKKLSVLVGIPPVKSTRADVDPRFIRTFAPLADLFFEMSLKGDLWRAMVLNGMTYSSILRYDPFPALRAVELGAMGAGLSGTGPAVAAVFDLGKREGLERLQMEWQGEGWTVLVTETNNEHGRLVSVG